MFFLLLLLIPGSAFAAGKSFDAKGFHITVEPIVGYELKQVNTPTVHTRAMLMYGARVTVGHKHLSGEGEYTLGSVNESFVLQDKNIKTDKQNVRLGLRSAIAMTSWSDFVFRAGGQATKVKTDTTTISTVTTVTDNQDWDIHPYAGFGLQGNFLQAFSLGLEVTYVFNSVKDWSQNEVQPSVSVKFRLPTK